MEFYNTTMKVLSDLEADTKQMLVVFNKIDKVADPIRSRRYAGTSGRGRSSPCKAAKA
jgi:50S ribosomal subunit-associated GTPase HflX